MRIIQAHNPEQIAMARELMREYQLSLGVDLCFQNFEAELRDLPGSYAPPSGRLLLAIRDDDELAGCVALQAIDEHRCEMKRLYVRPNARGLGIGRALIDYVLNAAREIGYRSMVLDTLPSLRKAQELYERYGFTDIEPYRVNPLPGVRFLGRAL